MEESMREEHSSKYSYFEMRNMWFPVKWHERRQSTDLKFLFSFKVESSPRKTEEPEKLQSKAFSPVKWWKPHGSKGQFQRSWDDRQGGLKPHSFLSTKIPLPVWNTECYAFMKFSPILQQWTPSTFSTWTHAVLWAGTSADVPVPVKNMQNLSSML